MFSAELNNSIIARKTSATRGLSTVQLRRWMFFLHISDT